MRAGVLVALVLLVGAFVGGAWWWIHRASETPAQARSPGSPVAARAPDPADPAALEPAAVVTSERGRSSLSALGYGFGEESATRESEGARRSEPDVPADRTIVVHVLDAETRTELDDVSVTRTAFGVALTSGMTRSGEPKAPTVPRERPPSKLLVEHARSPLSIDVAERGADPATGVIARSSFVFWSRGYVAALDALDVRDRTEPVVELTPAAALVVEIHGELPPSPPNSVADTMDSGEDESPASASRRERETRIRVRGRHRDSAPGWRPSDDFAVAVAQATARIGETVLEDLVPGDIIVSVEYGTRPPIVLASKPVTIVARQFTRVVLDLARIAVPSPTRLAGTLRLPPGASLDGYALEIAPRDIAGAVGADRRTFDVSSMEPVAGRSDTWSWEADGLLPGTYSISIRGTEVTKVLELPPSGETEVALEAPAQARLRVRVVSSSDGSPVKLSWVVWTAAKRDGEIGSVSPILLLPDDATRTLASNVPLGPGEVESFGADLWALDEAVRAEIFPGEQELVARVHAIGGARLVLTSGGKPIEIEQRLVDAITVAPVGGAGRCVWKRTRDKSPAFAVDPPGRWRVTLPTLDGYEPVAPFEVDVVIGKLASVPVELRRR